MTDRRTRSSPTITPPAVNAPATNSSAARSPQPASFISPTTDGPTGRSHHNDCYSSWLAGAGVRGGMIYGKSDDYGAKPVEDPVHVHDFHATILHLLGFDHEKLTFRHAGRDFRLTDVHGKVVKGLLA